jgi:hypothetical protein
MHIRGQSTQVTTLGVVPRRLPAYWFASRRRYFHVTFGTWRAMAIDLIALIAYSLGYIKQVLQRRSHEAVPHFIRDLFTHSILRAKNRHQSAMICTAKLVRDESTP